MRKALSSYVSAAFQLIEHNAPNRRKFTIRICNGDDSSSFKRNACIWIYSSGWCWNSSRRGPLIQKFIPSIAKSVNGLFGFGDDEIGRQTITLTGKEMIQAARRGNFTQRGIGFKFASNQLKGGGSNYKVYFGLVPV